MGLFGKGGWFNNVTSTINPFDDKNGAFAGSSDVSVGGIHAGDAISTPKAPNMFDPTTDPTIQKSAAEASRIGSGAYSDISRAANASADAGVSSSQNVSAAGQAAANYGQQHGQQMADYGTQQGSLISRYGQNQGADLQNAGEGLMYQGQTAQGRDVTSLDFMGANSMMGGATVQDLNAQNRALQQSQQNYDQANQMMGGANLNYGAANQSLQNANNLNFGAQNQSLGAANMYGQQLAGLENQQGPSAAQAQLASGLDQAQKQALSMARSGRGFGASAAGMTQAATLNANASQNAVAQSAQLRAQEYAAQQQRAAQNLASAAGIQQANAGQQMGQQQLGAQTALSTAGMQQDQQSQAAQLQMQKAAMLGQQQDAASQAALQRASQYGNQQQFQSGMEMQYGQNLQQQQALDAQTALQQAQQNDAYTQALYGMGMNAQQAGAQLGLGAMESGGQLGLAGQQAGYGLGMQGLQTNVGAQQAAGNLLLQGYGQQGALIGQGAGIDLAGNAQAFGQTTGTALDYDKILLGLYGIGSDLYGTQMGAAANAAGVNAGNAASNRDFWKSVVGSGMSAAGGGYAGSDRNMKKDIEPTNGVLKMDTSGADTLLGNSTGLEDEDQAPNPGWTRTSADPGLTEDDFQYNPYNQGVGISGPNQMQSGTASTQAADSASGAAQQQALYQQQNSAFAKGMADAGKALQQSQNHSIAPVSIYKPPYHGQQNYDNLFPDVLSDEESKDAIKKAPAYSYEYKDPEAMGAAHGTQYGPMAQDLEKTPAGRTTVKTMPDGTKMVDTSRLTLVNTAALHGMQKDLDALRAEIKSLRGGKKAA